MTAIDAVGVALVEIRLGTTTPGQLHRPAVRGRPGRSRGGAEWRHPAVSATATDLAGNTTTVTRGVRVASAGVVVGQVLDDATSLPLPGASVRIVSGSGGAAIETDERRPLRPADPGGSGRPHRGGTTGLHLRRPQRLDHLRGRKRRRRRPPHAPGRSGDRRAGRGDSRGRRADADGPGGGGGRRHRLPPHAPLAPGAARPACPSASAPLVGVDLRTVDDAPVARGPRSHDHRTARRHGAPRGLSLQHPRVVRGRPDLAPTERSADRQPSAAGRLRPRDRRR